MRKLTRFLVVAVSAIALASCFAEQTVPAASAANLPGFFKGFWHGLIAPIGFVVSLFSDHIRVYAVPNTGRWYDFGFMIGIGGFTHGVWHGSSRANAKRKSVGQDNP